VVIAPHVLRTGVYVHLLTLNSLEMFLPLFICLLGGLVQVVIGHYVQGSLVTTSRGHCSLRPGGIGHYVQGAIGHYVQWAVSNK